MFVKDNIHCCFRRSDFTYGVENDHNVESDFKVILVTFDVVINLNAIGKITTSKRIIKAIRTSKSEFSERRKANYHNVKKKRTSKVIICLKTTFDVVIILNAIGKIRTSKV